MTFAKDLVGKPDIRRTAAWAKLRKARVATARAQAESCCRCGAGIDYSLPGTARMGATIDHLRPIGLGGDGLPDLADLGVSHSICNLSHGARLGRRLQMVGGRSGAAPGGTAFASAPVSARVVSLPVDWSALQGGVDLSGMPADASPPRIFSPPHPRAVGSYGSLLADWADQRMGPTHRLRWWQRILMERAFEYDDRGSLVWRTVVWSTPRQVGKSWLIRETALARAAVGPGLFGEIQEIILASRTLTAASWVHSGCWQWAADTGLGLSRRFGSERVSFPDGSRWFVSSTDAIYGFSASHVFADEAWDIQSRTVTAGITPVLSARRSPQLWLLSTAHPNATDVVPRARVAAAKANSSVMLAEWSVDPGDDLGVLDSYRRASPHWDETRAELIEGVLGSEDVGSQFGNRWPTDGLDVAIGWPPGWAACGRVTGPPPSGGIAAVEVDVQRRSCGVAVAHADGSRVSVWTQVVPDDAAALAVLQSWQPAEVWVGASLHEKLDGRFPWSTRRASTAETRLATPTLLAAVRDGRLAHSHDPATDKQVVVAVAIPTETGPLLSARRSSGPISAVKSAAWAVSGVLDSPPVEIPQIW